VTSIDAEEVAIAQDVREPHRDLVPLGRGLPGAGTGTARLPGIAAAMTGFALDLCTDPAKPGAPNCTRTVAPSAVTSEHPITPRTRRPHKPP
jgi:hypothetical protein